MSTDQALSEILQFPKLANKILQVFTTNNKTNTTTHKHFSLTLLVSASFFHDSPWFVVSQGIKLHVFSYDPQTMDVEKSATFELLDGCQKIQSVYALGDNVYTVCNVEKNKDEDEDQLSIQLRSCNLRKDSTCDMSLIEESKFSGSIASNFEHVVDVNGSPQIACFASDRTPIRCLKPGSVVFSISMPESFAFLKRSSLQKVHRPTFVEQKSGSTFAFCITINEKMAMIVSMEPDSQNAVFEIDSTGPTAGLRFSPYIYIFHFHHISIVHPISIFRCRKILWIDTRQGKFLECRRFRSFTNSSQIAERS